MSNFEIDPNKQYILAGDISGSMDTKDAKCGGVSRYQYMLEKFKSFIKTAEDFDPDGPTVLLFGENIKVYANTNLEAVDSKLSNAALEGFTNTHLAIDEAFSIHCKEKTELAKDGKSHPGTILMLFTDGAPTNRASVARSIAHITQNIESRDEFSLTFLTVGTLASDLQEYLSMLDDNLKGAKYDIVDVKPLEDVNFLAAAKGALTD